eukprot:CAMPEP_0115369620 /NCGR_PEP_ID=MMETSP0270-20121206/106417_1 /TAXON_ID=71861 /ORGANISM="Scrippsiella trochoidea, Strain CCMP3099" /LENGTH=266 /DNA_ID=CAMNT_0002792433 /DNA_START=111 /DNA_END=912 /DNA_ORIENTATION=-
MLHRLGDTYRSVVSSLSKTNLESAFVEKGTLTPDEFVEAGEPSRRASYLPQDKQFLITRNVPSKDRVRALDYVLEHKTRTEDEWLLPETTNGGQAGDGELRDIDDLTGDDAKASGAPGDAGPIIVAQDDFLDGAASSGAGGTGLPDFSDLDAQLAEEDPAAASAPVAAVAFGYDENGKPLKPELIYEDVLSEYVEKTVTVDPHPLTGTPTVSIHPCKHSLVMKKVVQDWVEQGITPRHDLAIFVFLKFISGIVPTINYDFTMDIEI